MTEQKTNDLPLVNEVHYAKEISFENQNILSLLTSSGKKPEIQININVNVHPLDKKTYEVVLKTEAKALLEGNPSFLVELVYGGVFSLTQELPEEETKPLLLVEAPRLLFPFARALISQLTQAGGLPPLLLNTVDFLKLYQQQAPAPEETKH